MRAHVRRPAPLWIWTERVLSLAGAAALLWCALVLGDALLAQWRARQSLTLASAPAAPGALALPEALRLPMPAGPEALDEAETPPASAARSAAIAELSIPRIHLAAAVLHGTDERTLRRGPGHLENTPYPGERGNVVIAGHRDTFFLPLRHIVPGDDIYLATPGGRFHYRVTTIRVVGADDVSVLASSDEATLTLITCYPFWVLGPAPDRFVVSAEAVDAAAPSPDEQEVRDEVNRFQALYNLQLLQGGDVGDSVPLSFASCRVTVTADKAAADCDGASESRTFLLERRDGTWAIRSVMRR